MNKIKAFFKLVRWTNLLMIAIMMLLVYYCLMSPLLNSGIVGVLPQPPAFLLLLMSMIFIVAGGYVINDYFDVEIDKLNKPDKLIVTEIFSGKETKWFYIILTIIGLVSGFVSSVLIAKGRFITLFAPLVLLAALMYSYSSVYKRKFITGNLIVSLSVAFAVFLPWLFVMIYHSNNLLLLSISKEMMLDALSIVLVYTVFAFTMTLIREIVKDAEDYKGDIVTHCETIPIVCGIHKMNMLLTSIIVLLCVLLILFIIVLLDIQSYVTLGFIIVITISVLLSLPSLFRKNNGSAYYHRLSTFYKMMMLLGVLSMIFI
ncbi:MAG: geranylgeranylglycerol-phosphate geranylgeranyltransferase [Bacteroidales bacterium]|nr:geranylgeranylglycerol-phosphate geranylgeranyltransferase [Bacteroidales bacterium]